MTPDATAQGNTAIAIGDFRQAFNDLFTETFENVDGHYLDPGTSLLETLAGVDAATASQTASPLVATLAAQVEHVTYYLDVLDRHIRAGGYDENLKADWGAAWERSGVTPAEWQELIQRLRDAYASVRRTLEENRRWNADLIGGYFDIVVHTAYHLGEIRQALGVIRA